MDYKFYSPSLILSMVGISVLRVAASLSFENRSRGAPSLSSQHSPKPSSEIR